MNNLIDIQNQIEKLQKQASVIKAKEFHSTVQDIRSRMQAFGITVKDLQPAKRHGVKAKAGVSVKSSRVAAKKKTASVVAAKYQGPNNESWSGRGLTPRWMATLLAQGQKKEDFVIKN
jgi:DNA-binding protein H-NS